MVEGTKTPIVKGYIVLDKGVKSFSGATIYVSLRDVTMQDVGSKIISQQVIKDVSYNCVDCNDLVCNQKKIGFELFSDMTNFRRIYSISVHIDVDNNGEVNLGDYISMESYPVITHGYPRENISVRVRQLKRQ